MSIQDNRHDVIVVGSGAAGGWAAKVLTELGLKVLLLEAGARLDLQDELRRSVSRTTHRNGAQSAKGPTTKYEPAVGGAVGSSERQPVQSQCYAFDEATKHMFVDDVDSPYETPAGKPFNWIRMRLVGGRTALWNKVALRMSDLQFKAASIDGFGTDWPISYSDLEIHYNAIEKFVGVYGLKEGFLEVPDGCFIPRPLSTTALDFKNSVETKWTERKVTTLRQVCFLQPSLPDRELSPTGQVNLDEIQPFYCSAVSTIAAAERTGRLSLQCDAIVSRVITDAGGKLAVGVEYVDGGSLQASEVHAKVVVLCASTIKSTRILLNSTSRHHPHGIGNSTGILGKYLSEHTFGVGVVGRRKGVSGQPSNVYIPNFRNISGSEERFLRGYEIQGHIRPVGSASTRCVLWCFGEMLPREENCVNLSNLKDRWGIPVPRIDCTYSENELEMVADQVHQLSEMVQVAGYDVVRIEKLSVPGSSMHELGTARMGFDRLFSVLNPYNQCWDVPNLFVTDGAAFASAGFQNPTLTIMAITGRACHYMARELRRGNLTP